MGGERGEVTVLLEALRAGRPDAESLLLSLVYNNLKQLARGYMRKERRDHTLQPTDLVHEAYLRLVGIGVDYQDRSHFFRIAAQAMRRILVDHARAHRAEKRGHGARKVQIEEAMTVCLQQPDLFLELDEAVRRLAALDERQGRVVELRYYGGLSVEETAEALAISDRTVKRDWQFAQAFLRGELGGSESV